MEMRMSRSLIGKEKKSYVKWLWVLVFIEFAYVISEFAFNAALLNVSGGAATGIDSFDNIEVIGRLLSGVGFSLMVFGFYRMRSKFSSIEKEAVALVACMFICVPVMYVGQRALIDEFFVEPSTAQERLNAKRLSLLKEAMIRNVLVVPDAPFTHFDSENPEHLLFISIMSIALISEQNNSNLVDARKAELLENLTIEKAKYMLNESFAIYQDGKVKVDDAWAKYDEASRKYMELKNPSKAVVDREWAKYQSMVNKSFSDYKASMQKYYNTVESKLISSRFSSNIAGRYDNARYNCNGAQDCIISSARKVLALSKKATGSEYGYSTWCYYPKRDTGGKITNALFTDPLVNDVSIKGMICPSRKNKNYNMAKMVGIVARSNSEKFKKETGFKYGITTLSEFEKQSKTLEYSAKELLKQSVDVGKNWKGDYPTFSAAVKKRMLSLSHNAWDKSIGIEPGLNYAQFQKTPKIASDINDAMIRFSSTDRTITYNKDQFYSKLLEPAVRRDFAEYGKTFNFKVEDYEDGQSQEEEGKGFIRAAFIPPIALFFTLFFSLFSLSKIPLRMLTIAWIHYEKEIKKRWLRFLLTIDILFILGFPILKMSNKLTTSAGTVRLIDRTSTQLGPMAPMAFNWLMNAEPIIYPIGQKILAKRGFDNRDVKSKI